jgi:hypothetical protein
MDLLGMNDDKVVDEKETPDAKVVANEDKSPSNSQGLRPPSVNTEV